MNGVKSKKVDYNSILNKTIAIMKKTINVFLLGLIFTSLFSCKKTEDPAPGKEREEVSSDKVKSSFSGTYKYKFRVN
jgi:hypothetical protein